MLTEVRHFAHNETVSFGRVMVVVARLPGQIVSDFGQSDTDKTKEGVRAVLLLLYLSTEVLP